MDSPNENTVAMAANLSPPEVTGVALDSAVTFFREVKEHGLPTKEARRHALWFLYTVNEAIPSGVQLPAMSFDAVTSTDAKELAEQGLAAVDAAKLNIPAGAAAALDILAIMRIVQFILQILQNFPFFGGGGGNNNDGTVI